MTLSKTLIHSNHTKEFKREIEDFNKVFIIQNEIHSLGKNLEILNSIKKNVYLSIKDVCVYISDNYGRDPQQQLRPLTYENIKDQQQAAIIKIRQIFDNIFSIQRSNNHYHNETFINTLITNAWEEFHKIDKHKLTYLHIDSKKLTKQETLRIKEIHKFIINLYYCIIPIKKKKLASPILSTNFVNPDERITWSSSSPYDIVLEKRLGELPQAKIFYNQYIADKINDIKVIDSNI